MLKNCSVIGFRTGANMVPSFGRHGGSWHDAKKCGLQNPSYKKKITLKTQGGLLHKTPLSNLGGSELSSSFFLAVLR